MNEDGAADGVGVPNPAAMVLPLEAPKLLKDAVVAGGAAPKGLEDCAPKAIAGLLSALTLLCPKANADPLLALPPVLLPPNTPGVVGMACDGCPPKAGALDPKLKPPG